MPDPKPDNAPQNKRRPSTDHLGNIYPNQGAMCEAWGVKLNTYKGRIASGWTQDQALTRRAGEVSMPCTDHTGHEFPSISAMCKHWGTDIRVFNNRRKQGYSIQEALVGKRSCVDHKGKKYSNTTAMCEAWGIARTAYIQRIKHGWSLEEALTSNRNRLTRGTPSTDHLGNTYPSQASMLEYWGINRSTFNSRLRSGKTLEEALSETPRKKRSRQGRPNPKPQDSQDKRANEEDGSAGAAN